MILCNVGYPFLVGSIRLGIPVQYLFTMFAVPIGLLYLQVETTLPLHLYEEKNPV
jgi:hypothetical protein